MIGETFNGVMPANIVFLPLFLGAFSLLNSCAPVSTKPVRISNITYEDVSQIAYLMTSGYRHKVPSLADYATFTKIDDINLPAEYLSSAGGAPYYTNSLEIPAGEHTVEFYIKKTPYLERVLFTFSFVQALYLKNHDIH